MELRRNPSDPKNPIVFLDISIGPERVGRMILELRKDVVPKTAENFRVLCTGEAKSTVNGRQLTYKGTKFHKVQRVFMVQGGDVVNNSGSSGESIYGPSFEDENFDLLHEMGAISMANFGSPNTNNSQFFITSIPCPNLDGTNVVFGHVLRGFGILSEMEKYTTDDSVPLRDMIIYDCGEIAPGEPWNFYDDDETADKRPPFPMDWLEMPTTDETTLTKVMDILNSIKDAGNHFYKYNNFSEARRKYKKALRYYVYFIQKLNLARNRSVKQELEQFHLVNCLNSAAVELKLKNYVGAKHACNEVLKIDSSNPKALFRRGQAEIALKNYDEALKDLAVAYNISPNSKIILNEFNRAKTYWMDYHMHQKKAYKNLFKYIKNK